MWLQKKRDVLEHVCNYFDDIFFFLANQPIRITISRSFEFSLSNIWKMHFFCLSFSKKKKNTFPSWNVNLRVQKFYFWGYVSHNFVVFKGLKILNLLIAKHQPRHFWIYKFLRRVVAIDVIKQISILTPLTRSKEKFLHKQNIKMPLSK